MSMGLSAFGHEIPLWVQSEERNQPEQGKFYVKDHNL